MELKKVVKFLMAGVLCLNLFGCSGVHARIVESETEDTTASESEEGTDLVEDLEQRAEETTEESEVILDNTPEVTVLETESVAADIEEREATEAETMETESLAAESEDHMLALEYTIEDQKLESGKTFDDIVTPEYAVAEDGSEVTGEVEWLDPDSGMVLDSQMELSGADGENVEWEWAFIPEEDGYETAKGTVELTMYAAGHGSKNSIMDLIPGKENASRNDDKKQNTSSSGSSIGASNVKEVASILDTDDWMGSAMTGIGVLGNNKESGDYTTDNGKFTITHGVVKRDTEEAQTEEQQTENREEDTEEMEEATFGSVDNNPNVIQFPEKHKSTENEKKAAKWYKTGCFFLVLFQMLLWK